LITVNDFLPFFSLLPYHITLSYFRPLNDEEIEAAAAAKLLAETNVSEEELNFHDSVFSFFFFLCHSMIPPLNIDSSLN
jgi:hypothetical protein